MQDLLDASAKLGAAQPMSGAEWIAVAAVFVVVYGLFGWFLWTVMRANRVGPRELKGIREALERIADRLDDAASRSRADRAGEDDRAWRDENEVYPEKPSAWRARRRR